jgi:Tat protein secretion system quality control protein TatD with DNase activity
MFSIDGPLASRLFPVIGIRIITELSSPEDLPDLEEMSNLSNAPIVHHFSGKANEINQMAGSGFFSSLTRSSSALR